jgi:thiol-disulfide isomerase/thioredoxin
MTGGYTIKAEIEEMRKWAENKKGKLLSVRYINAHVPMRWKCEKEHVWESSWTSIKNGNSWCPYCVKNVRFNIKELQDYATSKNGTLLSTAYVNCKKPLLWECEKKHIWMASWDNIHNGDGSWCPECVYCKTEFICRQLLEQKLNIKFNKIRFYYKNKRLEFDGYNKENRIAFEYQGYQHYVYPNRFHKTVEIFEKAKQRDELKKQYCIANNIDLILIPYTESANLAEYIDKVIPVPQV